MSKARRFDLVDRKADKAELTEQGFLRIPAVLTRTGVFDYRKADGTLIRELRHPDDVFEKASLESLRMAPVTDDHPSVFVDPENAKELTIGWLGDSIEVLEDRKVTSTVVVSDKKTIAKIDAGKVELSCGYTADLVDESGVYEGQRYDLRQKNIRYNHVALVDRGRAGPEVRLRLDSDDANMVESVKDEKLKEAPEMEKIKIDGKEYEVDKKVADAFNAFMKKTEDEMTKMKDGAKEKADLEKEKSDMAKELEKTKKDSQEALDAIKAKLDHAEKSLNKKEDSMNKDEILKLVKERKKIEDVAEKVLGTEAKMDSSDLELMKAVIMKDDTTAQLEGQSEIYIKGRFDALAAEVAKRSVRATEIGTIITDGRKPEEFDAKTAKERAHKDSLDAWKQPTSVVKK